MVIIQKTNDHFQISYAKQKPHPVVIHAVEAFGHLIKNGQILWAKQFANLIAEHYSIENPKTAEVIRMLNSAR